MSHTTKVNSVRVHNVQALATAITELNASTGLNITMHENTTCRLWGSSTAKCDVVLKIPGQRFDVGFQKAPDGNGLVPIFDAHGGELYRVIGQGSEICQTREDHNLSNIAKVMQAYTQQAIYAEALAQSGNILSQTVTEQGAIVMQVGQY